LTSTVLLLYFPLYEKISGGFKVSGLFNKENLFKGVRLFLFLTFIAVTLMLVFTVSKETGKELMLISPLFIVLTVLATFLSQLFNVWRLRYIIKALGEELSWTAAFYFTIGGLFLGGVTPLQVGGLPLQLYICRREGITIPEASAAIFTRGLLSAFVLPFFAPFIYYNRIYFTSGIMQGIIKYLSILYGAAALLFIFVLIRTDWLQNKFRGRFFKGKFFKGVIEFKEVFREEFANRKKPFFKAYFLTGLSMIFNFLIAFFLLRGLGVNANFFRVTILQIVLTYSLAFMPTPGASGLAEGSAFGLFRDVVPKSILGVYVVLWRFFTSYLGMIVGGIALSRYLVKIHPEVRKKKKEEK
jgi:uncharacterized protein (TIRG00374 family)